jgi:hypothetical protein
MSRSATRSVPPTCPRFRECRHEPVRRAMEQTHAQLQAVVVRSLTRAAVPGPRNRHPCPDRAQTVGFFSAAPRGKSAPSNSARLGANQALDSRDYPRGGRYPTWSGGASNNRHTRRTAQCRVIRIPRPLRATHVGRRRARAVPIKRALNVPADSNRSAINPAQANDSSHGVC